MDELIRMEKIEILSEGFEIIKNMTLNFPRGMSTVIIGPSGCGKSTLLKAAAGILLPSRGSLFFEGKNFFKMSEEEIKEFRRKNGFVFQDSALWANRSLYQNLSLPLEFHYPYWSEEKRSSKLKKLLDKTGLTSQSSLRPAQLSTGEGKIVSILRALVTDPSLLFLDEPTLSVDTANARIIYDMIRDLKNKGCTLITATHDPGLISWLADYLVALKTGELLAFGPFDEVTKSPNPEVRQILGSVLMEAASYDTDILGLLNQE